MQRFTSPPLVWWIITSVFFAATSFALLTTMLVFHERYSVIDMQMTQLCGIAKALSGQECLSNNQTTGCRLAHALYVGACPPLEEPHFMTPIEAIALGTVVVFFIFLVWCTDKRRTTLPRNP